MAYLELKNIKKSFGEVNIIKGVDLQIQKGEPITSGNLLLDGKDITWTPSGKRDLAMVFQSYALYPHMSVYDNMSFALKLAGVSKDEIKTKVEYAARTLNLTQYLDRTPKELSGGQRQRVAIGRAIVRAPKVFLFDEPLSNLDAALRGNTRVEIHKLHRALGATTIYVTHDQVEAMTLADRVVVLKDGLIEQVGTPLELYDRPANQFVAQFIGMPSMNMMAASAIPSFSAATGGRLPSDGFLGVRPEGLRVHPKQGAPVSDVQGRVELIEALGADTLIHVDVGGVPLIARQNDRTPLQAGDDVAVELDPSVLHLFNREGRSVGA